MPARDRVLNVVGWLARVSALLLTETLVSEDALSQPIQDAYCAAGGAMLPALVTCEDDSQLVPGLFAVWRTQTQRCPRDVGGSCPQCGSESPKRAK